MAPCLNGFAAFLLFYHWSILFAVSMFTSENLVGIIYIVIRALQTYLQPIEFKNKFAQKRHMRSYVSLIRARINSPTPMSNAS